MNMEKRLERLEDLIGVGDEIPPLIRIDAMDCSRGSTDPGTPTIGVIPGKIGGPCGVTLFREKNEDPDSFLERCEAKHAKFYAT